MRKLLLTYITALFCTLAWAQNGTTVATAFPYECSFEEGENLSAWHLNYRTSSATDKWVFGGAVHSEGKRSMYISAYDGDFNYGKKNVVVSYLRYKFPTSSKNQKYDVSFDWKGQGDSTTSKLYVMYCPESEFVNNTDARNYYDVNKIVSTTSGNFSNDVMNVCQTMSPSGENFLCGSERWQNASFAREVSIGSRQSQLNFVFVFIWVNNNSRDSVGRTSIAIDNFQITSAAIKPPTDLVIYPQCEDSSLLVTWESTGAATEYDIQYRKVGEDSWTHGRSGISEGMEGFTREGGTKCSYALNPLLEGSYDVRIRSAYYDEETNQTIRSRYVYESLILMYCPENHCVNYINLDDPDVVCTTGMNPDYYSSSGQTPYDVVGKVDFGPDAVESRHTLHVDPTEVDPRTDSLLHTVPEGALASVRLGNWNWGGEAESVTYTINVDSFHQGILLVQYAVVLENPGTSHDKNEEPRFELEILDKDGNLIDTDCGHAVFSYSDGAEGGWKKTQGDKAVWKDWTTVGVNLMDYHGDDIKVRFTTYDCSQGGHYAYAYFTVDCANAHIETENCGSDAQVTCIAPDGFSYLWYRNDDINDVVGTDQTLVVEATKAKYTCRASFIGDPDCFFEISTTSEPRFPVPEYTVRNVFDNCQSKLVFTNSSHVMNKYDGYENHTAEKSNETRWSFRSFTTGQTRTTTAWDPQYNCLSTGDTIEVTVTTYIGADNSCDSTRVDTIVVPDITPRDSTLRLTTCTENPVKFDNRWFDADTVYRSVAPNFAGCDSVATLYLKVFPKPEDHYRHDSICSDQSLIINGVRYNQTLDKYPIIMQNRNGCDSVVYLTLTVNQRLQADIPQMPYACADDEQLFVNFDIAAGVFDSLRITFSTPELRDTMIYDPYVSSVAIPYPETITPGHYSAELRFYQFCCGIYREVREFDIRYRSSIVEQKWNDVLTLLSPKYNGGYEFTAFRWFKNGELIEGENHSYLYQPLDFEAYYYAELTRPDGTVMTTCPIQPVYHEQQSEYPTIVQPGQRVPMYMESPATVWYYTVSGQLYSSFTLRQGYTSLPVPEHSGVFVIKAVTAEGESKAQVMIVQ